MPKIPGQFGLDTTPLGFDRLAIVEWFHILIQLHDLNVAAKLIELQFPKLLLQMMRTHEMNSFLHTKIFNIFNDSIVSGIGEYVNAVRLFFYISLLLIAICRYGLLN